MVVVKFEVSIEIKSEDLALGTRRVESAFNGKLFSRLDVFVLRPFTILAERNKR